MALAMRQDASQRGCSLLTLHANYTHLKVKKLPAVLAEVISNGKAFSEHSGVKQKLQCSLCLCFQVSWMVLAQIFHEGAVMLLDTKLDLGWRICFSIHSPACGNALVPNELMVESLISLLFKSHHRVSLGVLNFCLNFFENFNM